MSEKTANSFFIVPPLVKHAGFYQELLRGIGSYQQLGNKLIQLAEQAHAFRQFDKAKEYGQILSNIPIKHYQSIGYYFLAVAANHNGNGDQEKARKLFELVADTAPPTYKTKAILSLAGVSANTGNYDSELYYLLEGLKASTDLSTTLSAYRGIAIVKSKEGYHSHALRDLEKLNHIIRFAPPLVYFDYMNSMAVELCEVGRLQEAKNVSALVCNSPLAPYYKEWRETYSEVNQKAYKNRSTVRVTLPKREPKRRVKKAKILQFPQRKRDSFMRASCGPPTRAEISEAIDRGKGLDPKQIHALILKVVLQDRVTDDEIMHIVEVYYDAMVHGLD